MSFSSLEEAWRVLGQWIEGGYNRFYVHSVLGYRSPQELPEFQGDLDLWLRQYNEERPHSGRYCYRKTQMQTFLDAIPTTMEKMIGYEMTA